MKSSFKAIISLILVTIILLTAISCSNNTPEETTTGAGTTEPSTPDIVELLSVISGTSESEFMLIRGMNATETEISAASSINMALRKKFSDAWPMAKFTDDWVKGLGKDEVYSGDEFEILVGYTNRKESRDVYEELSMNEFAVRAVGNKIVIIGYDEYLTSSAAAYFVENFINTAEDGKLTISRNLNIKEKASIRQVAVNAEADYRVLTWNLGCSVGVAKDALSVILRYFPDILCLQEADSGVHKNVISALPDYMVYANKYHSNGTTYVYTPILYNSNLFTLVASDVEWLDGRYPYTNTKSVAWAVFKDKNDETFAVINFHGAVCSANYKGYENMTNAERNEVALNWRIDNVRQIIGIKNKIKEKHGNIPTMVMGDCNFNDSSVPYANMIKEGFVTAEITARLGRVTGYATYFSYGTSIKTGKSIDHIFQIGGIDFVSHMIVRDSLVETASDHCPVYTDFNITKK